MATSMVTYRILRMLGAERRRTPVDYVLPAIGYFAAGALVGTAATLLLTPKTGREMRQVVGTKAAELRERFENGAEEVLSEVKGHLPRSMGDEGDRGENGMVGRARKIPVKTT